LQHAVGARVLTLVFDQTPPLCSHSQSRRENDRHKGYAILAKKLRSSGKIIRNGIVRIRELPATARGHHRHSLNFPDHQIGERRPLRRRCAILSVTVIPDHVRLAMGRHHKAVMCSPYGCSVNMGD
jgi:hypothetical protein